MANQNLLHIKGSRVQIYKTLPSSSVGNDGDIILAQIQGRGVFLCSKVNGKWHVSTKMEESRKIEKTSIKDLKLDRLRVGTATITKGEYDVSVGDFTLDVAGNILLTPSTDVKSDSPLKIKEASNAVADTAAYGQLWVKTATPNQLYFTTDAGDDIQITSGTATAFVGDITGVTAGTNCSGGGTSGSVTINVDDAFLINDGSDTTTGTITAGGFTTTGTITMPELTDDAAIGITKIQDSGTSFTDNDTSIMTAAAIADKIEGYGYSTTAGDITGVTITTDSGGGSAASDTSGSADFSILGSSGVGVTNSGTTITAVAVAGEIDHDSLSNFVANEHIDWTGSSAGTIHSSNYTDTNTNQLTTFTVSATTDSNATTISQGDDLMFTAGTGITCETTADGTVTITNTVSDTNTTYSGGTNLTLSTTTFNVDDAFITNDAADIMAVSDFGAVAALKIDADQPATAAAEDSKGLWIDYDRAQALSGTAAHNDIGIDLDVTSASLGTSSVIGLDVDVDGTGAGTSTAKGIFVDVDGADTNTGLEVKTDGTHIKLVYGNDTNDYATMKVTDTGDLTIAAISGSGEDADIILEAEGDIELKTGNEGNIKMSTSGFSGDGFVMTASDFGAHAAVKIDADQPATIGAEDSIGLWIDYDRIVAGAGANAHNDIGIDLDVNVASLGTSSVRGMDIDVVGATSGTHTAIGIDLDVDSADTNIGMIINTAGTHLKLVANADADDYATFTLADTGDLTIATVGDGTTDSDLTLDADGDIYLEAAGGDVRIDAPVKLTSTTADQFAILYDASNYALLNVSATGDLEIETIGAGTTDSDITLNADGDILMDAAGGDVTITSADLSIPATKKLYLDGGGDTYISENSADNMRFVVGGDTMINFTEGGSAGNVVNYAGSTIVTIPIVETFSDDSIIGSGGTHDTHIDFRIGQKAKLSLTADITTMNLIFPSGICANFVLICDTDGDHDVTNWKVFEEDASAASGDADVLWAGGSVPAFTSSGIDIVSFVWDGVAQKCYGVASLDFDN